MLQVIPLQLFNNQNILANAWMIAECILIKCNQVRFMVADSCY